MCMLATLPSPVAPSLELQLALLPRVPPNSAYSNSFVNLAIFKPDVEREKVASIIGKEAEELTHLFCIVSVMCVLGVYRWLCWL